MLKMSKKAIPKVILWKVVHEYFPTDLQMRDILRILSDNAQTPCVKSKIAMLKFLTELATTYCQPSDLPAVNCTGGGTGSNSLSVDRALLKIVQLCLNHKSLELNSQARLCLVSLYNCNTPQMTKWLAELPKTVQDDAKSIIQAYLEYNSNSPNVSPLSSSSPKSLQSPALAPFISLQNTLSHNASPRSRQESVDQDLYSQLDVQHNIHKTSEEIRNYTSSVVAQDTMNSDSQLNVPSNANGFNGYEHADQLDSNMTSFCNSQTQSAVTTETNTPESGSNNTIQPQDLSTREGTPTTVNALTSPLKLESNTNKFYIKYSVTDTGELILKDQFLESEIIKTACSLNADVPIKQLQETLNNLSVCIKGGNGELPNKHFRSIMKMLVELLDTQQDEIVKESLHVLGKIIRSENMRNNWIEFLELILLRIIGCYSKDTAREIDLIIPRIASALPLHATIDIVNPVIATSPYPLNLCAVKILSELAERHGSELTEAHLDCVFPNLARLSDVQQSSVRKAAVFCIVKLFFVMGEEKVTPKFNMLTPSKVRLLNVYIEKQRTSSSASTKTSSVASSS